MTLTKQALLLSLTLLSLALSAAEPVVVGWVPSYGVEECKANLMDSTKGVPQCLNRLCLLWWNPEAQFNNGDTVVSGKLEFADQENPWFGTDSSDVPWFREWATENDVELLLSVGYIMVPGEEFTVENLDVNSKLEKMAFHDQQDVLIRELLEHVERYNFDGVDLDFEHLLGYREEYAGFVQRLGDSLHSRGKILTICVMPSTEWYGVNSLWWEDYVGYVDAINIMGYQDIFAGNTSDAGGNFINTYANIINYGLEIGFKAEQIVMLMPAWLDDWGTDGRGTSALDHLQELRDVDTTLSVGFCEMRLMGKSWNDPLTWRTIALLNEEPKIVMNEVTLPEIGAEQEPLSLSWQQSDVAEHQTTVVSIRAFDTSAYMWQPLDTLPATAGSYELDLSAVQDSLFTVQVAMVDEAGAVIDYALTGTYFILDEITPIAQVHSLPSAAAQVSLNGRDIHFSLAQAEAGTVKLFDLSGRAITTIESQMQAGVNQIALPTGIAAGSYLLQIQTESLQKNIIVQMR